MLSWCIEHLFAVGLIFGHKLFQRYPFSLLLAFGLAILAIVPPTADGIASFLQARLRPQYRIPKDNVAIITDDLLVPLVNPKEYPLSCLGRSEFLCQIRVFVLFSCRLWCPQLSSEVSGMELAQHNKGGAVTCMGLRA